MLGFKPFVTASAPLEGIEVAKMICKGQLTPGLCPFGQVAGLVASINGNASLFPSIGDVCNRTICDSQRSYAEAQPNLFLRWFAEWSRQDAADDQSIASSPPACSRSSRFISSAVRVMLCASASTRALNRRCEGRRAP